MSLATDVRSLKAWREGSRAVSPTARRVAFARRLYAAEPAALARLGADPDAPRRVLEYRLDRWLCTDFSDAVIGYHVVVATFLTRVGRVEADGTIRLRALALDMAPAAEPVVIEHRPHGWAVRRDLAWVPAGDAREYTVQYVRDGRLHLLPADVVGPPLVLPGGRPCRTWDEAYWLAGSSGDGLYLADHPEDAVRAIRVAGLRVAWRGFGQVWRTVGTIEET
jgi:hypothetical protein